MNLLRPTRRMTLQKWKEAFPPYKLQLRARIEGAEWRDTTAELWPGVGGAPCVVSPDFVRSFQAPLIGKIRKRRTPRLKPSIKVDLEVDADGLILRTSVLADMLRLPAQTTVRICDPVLDTLGEVLISEGDGALSFCYPKFWMFNKASLDNLAATAVLILGAYSTETEFTLRFIETTVNALTPLRGWLLRDYDDIAGRHLHQKLCSMAAVSRFVILEDSSPSGHLVEWPLIRQIGVPIGILRARGTASSWMTDPLLSSGDVKLVEYISTDPLSLHVAVGEICSWAEAVIRQRAAQLDHHYPWRRSEIALADELFPPEW